MQVKLTIQERLKDLRVERGLTLEQLAEQTGLSKSALGKYEADDFKDISPFSIVTLAKFYGVSTDYLLGMTETKNHPDTELDALHLSDNAVEVLRTGKFNHRLLSEMLCHKDFQRMMLDAEIYVDRIADMRINDMNAMLEAVRKMALMKQDGQDDLSTRTLELAQVREDDYFGHVLADDLKAILRDIREKHSTDTTTADTPSIAEEVQAQLQDAMNFEGSDAEKQARIYLATFGIDYDAIIVIDDLKWSFDSKIVPKSKGTWLTAMTALLGATLGASFGGFTGAVIGLTLGAMIGLYITGFDPEYWKNEMGAKEMWTVVIAGLIGAVLGAAFTGIVGAGVGFSLGAVLGLFLVDFAQEEQGGVPELFRELMVVLCALLGIVIGSKVAPGVGTVVGLSIGLAVGLLLYELDKDPKDRSETFRKIGQGIILGLVAGAFGVALAALGVVSTGAAFVISLSIGLILRLFVQEVDDSAVKGYGSKVSLVNPSFTGNLSTHSMPTYRSVPALARGAVIPPNREFLAVLGDQKSGNNYEVPDAKLRQLLREELSALGGKNEAVLMLDRDVLGRVVYQLNRAEGNRIGVSLTGV